MSKPSSPHPHRSLRHPSPLAGLCIALAVGGCSDEATVLPGPPGAIDSGGSGGSSSLGSGGSLDESTSADPGEPAGGNVDTNAGGTAGEGSAPATPDPLYAMALSTWNPDLSQGVTYLVTVDSLDAGTEISAGDGIEIPWWTGSFGIDKYPALWIHGDVETVVERWGLTNAGLLEREGTVSFANLGFQGSPGFVWLGDNIFLSPELALMCGRGQFNELVRWNPTSMQVLPSLPLQLPGSLDDGFAELAGGSPRSDGTLILGWTHEQTVGFVTLNQDATQVLGQDQFPAGLAGGMPEGTSTASDGTVYVGPLVAQGADEAGNPTYGPPIVYRIAAGATQYDRDWQVNLLELTAFEGAYDAAYNAGMRGTFFVDGQSAYFAFRAPEVAASWFRWDLETNEVRRLPNTSHVGDPSDFLIRVGERWFVQDATNVFDADSSTDNPFFEITEDGVVPAFYVRGGGAAWEIWQIR
jgi:hypothetical protein